MPAKTLMIQGTGSSAGKSLLTAAMCRAWSRQGVRVAPFKAQNMSNNAAVCADGSEIGRSQALQAQAAGAEPRSDMNPVLLKPEGDCRSQVIVGGRPWMALEASDYYARKQVVWPVITSALDRLRDEFDVVVIEGAGSPAELNLARSEVVNMAVARYCRSPVVLVGDIERGGVFAQLLGTLWLLPERERTLVRGLIVNKFRGDPRLFDQGVEALEAHSGLPVLGVLPWIEGLLLPEEDALGLPEGSFGPGSDSSGTDSRLVPRGGCSADRWAAPLLDVAIVQFPRIANFDDFDPLANQPGMHLRYVRSAERLGRPDVVILPGTKNTLADLQWLWSVGLAQHIQTLARRGAAVVGICGGYQMLGRTVSDPQRIEGERSSAAGLELLSSETVLSPRKQTHRVEVEIADPAVFPELRGVRLSGYEIHLGETRSDSTWLELRRDSAAAGAAGPGRFDGGRSADGRVWGSYVHGLFHNDSFRNAWLTSLGAAPSRGRRSAGSAVDATDQSLDRLADAFESEIGMSRLDDILWNRTERRPHVG